MAYSAKLILDSVNKNGNRLITVEASYPRCIHSELMTHRQLSRNAASSRAIPVEKMLSQIQDDPFIPERFGINQSGMQSEQFHEGEAHESCVTEWLSARDSAYKHAKNLLDLKVHKQLANRILEPFSWITVIITATDWDNFFWLRCNKSAQPEIQKIAYMIKEEISLSKPKLLQKNEWHTPYIQNFEELENEEEKKKISTARSARVSYLTHDKKRDISADLNLFKRLDSEKHMSPFEHVARPAEENEKHLTGNFTGWVQYRKLMNNESVIQKLYTFNEENND